MTVNVPEPLPEVQCPSCGATIRARMADHPDPDDDLRVTMRDALGKMFASNNERDVFLARLTPAVQAYVDSQVAAARIDERAKAYAEVDANWSTWNTGG